MKRGSSLVLAGALIALGTSGAAAQNMLSVEELKSCLVAERSLEQQRTDIERRSAALEDARSALRRAERDITERRMFMDAEDERLRAQYQSLLMQERRMSRIYQQEIQAHNEHVEAYNAARTEYMANCADRMYSDAVMSRARRELGGR